MKCNGGKERDGLDKHKLQQEVETDRSTDM